MFFTINYSLKLENVKVLVEFGADAAAVDAEGKTPLHLAAEAADAAIAAFLLEKKPPLAAVEDKRGRRAAHAAAAVAAPAVLSLLIDNDPDCVDAVVKNGTNKIYLK